MGVNHRAAVKVEDCRALFLYYATEQEVQISLSLPPPFCVRVCVCVFIPKNVSALRFCPWLDGRCDAGAFCYGFGWTFFYLILFFKFKVFSLIIGACVCVLFEVVTFFLKMGGKKYFVETVKD